MPDGEVRGLRALWVFAAGGLVAVAVGLSAPAVIEMAVTLGNGLVPYPGKDLATDYVVGVLWAAAIGVTILAWPVRRRDKGPLLWIWVVKSMVTLGLMLLYEYRYGVDPDGSFTNATASDFVWEGLRIGEGTRNIQSLAWLQDHIVPGSYHASKVSFSLVGLVGVYIFYRASVIVLQHEDRRVLYALAFFPTILFWSSILGKDPVVFFGTALYVYGVVAWWRFNRLRYLLPMALGITVVVFVRMWLGPILLLPLGAIVLGRLRGIASRCSFLIVLVSAFLLSLDPMKAAWRIETAQDVLDFRDYLVTAFQGGGSTLEAPQITGISDVVIFVPRAIFTMLFRPLGIEMFDPFGLVVGMENVLLLCFLGLAVKRTYWHELKEPLLIWSIVLILVWGTAYGLVTFNLGTAVRYKLQIMPVLLGLVLYLARLRPRA